MDTFQEIYQSLNKAQRQAVDTTEGPVLVIAGPGTGKTQLLGARVANILLKTDTPAANILCLTFTESGAANMRSRLTRFIGQTAYDVNIGTYHAFGGDLIRRYPEYFSETRLQTAVDRLGQHQIVGAIVESMAYDNPLKQTRHHIGDLISTISEIKRALLDGPALTAIAKENLAFIHNANGAVAPIFKDFVRMPGTFAKAAPYFEQTIQALQSVAGPAKHEQLDSLSTTAIESLEKALQTAAEANKSKPLTDWKNDWLEKDDDNKFCLQGELESKRIAALATVMNQYQAVLETRGLYDFDDMILRSINALEKYDNFRYSLQERYLYILLDEFQDTNRAQAKLVQLLTNNPVNEGKPNVMAVGDDDQAIYAFQGADYSNMLNFHAAFRDVAIINLTENYRSQAPILAAAGIIAGSISSSLKNAFEGMTKELVAANKKLAPLELDSTQYLSPLAQYDGIASRIEALIKSGVPAEQIAVLAPWHKQLEPLVPYLNERGIPVSYEKREDILKTKIVRQLITMSRLTLALHDGNEQLANALWPEVLSFEFWELPIADIWQLSWSLRGSRDDPNWTKTMLDSKEFSRPALLFLTVASKVETENCETILDYLMGSVILQTNDAAKPTVSSPLRDYYTSPDMQTKQPGLFYETLSHLTVLREKLRDYQASAEAPLLLIDLLQFVGLYEAAEQPMLNSSPYHQQASAVQLMTVFKAKGLEFAHVFLASCQDDVWGNSSRGNSNKLSLPANLAPIRHAGATQDERLRILFVAMTRAKYGLHLTSYASNFSGKSTTPLKYFDVRPTDDGLQAFALPEPFQRVTQPDTTAPALGLLELNWHSRHSGQDTLTDLRGLLAGQLEKYQLSPTHLTTFVDLQYNGPESFFIRSMLHFPSAPTPDSEFGTAIHESLEWLQHQLDQSEALPPAEDVIKHFEKCIEKAHLPLTQHNVQVVRGRRVLKTYLSARSTMFQPGDLAEKNFRNENVFVGDVHMAGKIDRLEIDHKTRTITVVDYKTGNVHNKWNNSDQRLHLYSLQLYAYKLLVEHSRSFKGYVVTKGRLEFIEPDQTGRIQSLELVFTEAETARIIKLMTSLWQHIRTLSFPDVSAYSNTVTAMRQFQQDLIESKI
jgi:DNA helicase-2/ATP-dependent DNA helicase PcrA